MKWIGQHIYDLVSRFRNDVYLESISTGTIASGGNLGLDSNNKIVKADEATGDITSITLTAGTGVDLTSISGATSGAYEATIGVDVSDFMSSGVDNRVLTATGTDAMQAEEYFTFQNTGNISRISLLSNQDTGDKCTIDTTTHGATTITTNDDDAAAAHFEIAADGNITLDAAGDIYNEADAVYFTSTSSSNPIINIKNFVDDANGARLRFTKDKGGAGADGDDIGTIEFVADDTAQALTHFGSIIAEVSEADNTDEAGKLTFKVAASDGTDTALTNGLVIEGEHATGSEVDVTIANGTASTTTIAGDLSVTTGLILDSVDITTIQTGSESFADNDTSLMTSAAVNDRINRPSGQMFMKNFNFSVNAGTTEYYFPFASTNESTSSVNQAVTMIMPTAGKLIKIHLRTSVNHSGQTTTFTLYNWDTDENWNNSNKSVLGVQSGTGPGIGEVVTYDFTSSLDSGTNAFTANEMIAVSFQNGSDPGSNTKYVATLVFELDWTSY